MENFTVRLAGDEQSKSAQDLEKEVLAKHEQEEADRLAAEQETVRIAEEEAKNIPPVDEKQVQELKEEDVLSFIKGKYNKQINSIDELLVEKDPIGELPEDVSAYYKYKKETGRGIDDFVKLNRDINAVNPDDLLVEYLLATEEGIDSEDVDSLMSDYRYDELIDDEDSIKKAKLAKKKAVAKAKKYFEAQKEQYKIPVESTKEKVVQFEEPEDYKQYKQQLESAKAQQEEAVNRRSTFLQKTDEVFNESFKGFEFEVGEEKFTFAPGDASELKKNQLDTMNFIGKYMDDKGVIKDAVGYHRALAIAMNPEKFAKFFYEQGAAKATQGVMKDIKNINMTERKAPEVTTRGGFQVKAVDSDSGRGLRIRSLNNKK